MGEMSFLGWIIIGFFAGWMGSKFMGTDKDQGTLANIIVGVIGAFVGGFVVNLLGGAGITGFNVWSFVVAVLGSIIFLWFLKNIRK